MKRSGFAPLLFSLLTLSACVHSLSMHSTDGEKWSGRYRFARQDTGLIQVMGSDGEVLNGTFERVARTTFVKSYEQTFGRRSIAIEAPGSSAYGNAFDGFFGSSRARADAAYGETFNRAYSNSEVTVRGPLFYWTASLQGDRGTTMACYFIGSSYTGSGFGRCRNHTGNDYSVEF